MIDIPHYRSFIPIGFILPVVHDIKEEGECRTLDRRCITHCVKYIDYDFNSHMVKITARVDCC